MDLAEALAEHRAPLAGELAALEFERAVQEYAKVKPDKELTLEKIINDHAPSHYRDYWQRCRFLRNSPSAVHGRELARQDVDWIVRHTRDIRALTQQRRRLN